MHRSGTSALTGVLSLLGLDLGRTIMQPTEENPRGYFENQRVNELNEGLLSAIGSSWHDVFGLEEKWWEGERADAFSSSIKTLIGEEFPESGIFAIKDPRICRLFPLWRRALEDMGIRISAVIPVRHPSEVAESLRLRHGFSLQKGLVLWMIHTLSAELHTRDIPRVWISFEALLRQTEKTAARIFRGLGIEAPRPYNDARLEIAGFLDPALKHFDHKGRSRPAADLPAVVREWHRLMAASCRSDAIDRKTLKAMDTVREEFERLRAFFHHAEIRSFRKEMTQTAPRPSGKAPDEQGRGSPGAAPDPPVLSSESWQWLREYREAAVKAGIPRRARRRPEDFFSGPLTYRARIIRREDGDLPHNGAQRVKIVHAIANLRTGGSTRLVVDLFEGLGHLFDQEVISADIPDPLHYTGFPFHDFSEPVTVDELEAFFREKAPRIIHVHHWLDPWYEKVIEAASRTDAVVIENVNTPFQILRNPAVARYVFVSRHARDSISPAPADASVIYPGSDGVLFPMIEDPSEDTIGMVYRLERDKLSEDSIRPLIEAVRRRSGTRVIIVGGGSLLSSYRRQVAEAEVAGRFLFTGYVPYHDLPRWYAKFSVFAAPVWNESFGQVTPFAMASGIPVAGYKVGALPEILGAEESPSVKGCLAEDEEKLTEIIIRLLDDRPLRLALGRELRARFDRLFTLEAMIVAYERLYEELLAGRPTPSQAEDQEKRP